MKFDDSLRWKHQRPHPALSPKRPGDKLKPQDKPKPSKSPSTDKGREKTDDVFDKKKSPLSQGEKEGLKANPELKARQPKDPKSVDGPAKTKTERQRTEEKVERQSAPPSVFGKDRVTISAEAQVVPTITRKADLPGVKKNRQKYIAPGLSRLAAKANPAPKPPAPPAASFDDFLGNFIKNFS